ncbi:hypothetical protein L5515_002509 [Caenorhabditis briggsae]|uniref:V-type proton ATPase subunit S1/VOA1 transmembrane domain-containing protein n=1 Tax=Caenorhabditis briggsae TaxID=6238 RepID=A0AAE9E7S5_CAEBR|nr:hypothetical protein L5515_002509 [Caenorhabditis briggsae]
MFKILSIFLLFSPILAYDAIIFSNHISIRGISIENLLKDATADEPIVIITNQNFTLGQFSMKANAYSSEPIIDFLANSVKNSKFHESRNLVDQIEAPNSQKIDNFQPGSSILIISGESWDEMVEKFTNFEKIDNRAIMILTSSEAISTGKNRLKRSSAPLGAFPFPLIIPPYGNPKVNITRKINETCLFYLGGVTVVVENKLSNQKTLFASAMVPGANLTYSHALEDVKCEKGAFGNFIFRFRLKLAKEISGKIDNSKSSEKFVLSNGDFIDFSLKFHGDFWGYWRLIGATMHSIGVEGREGWKTLKSVDQTIGPNDTKFSKLASISGFSLTCHQSQALFFPTNDPKFRIGISLINSQIQTFTDPKIWDKMGPRFSLQTEDCTGTFSPGSLMGILTSLVMTGGVIFAFWMLQSIKTPDRFDDPKKTKQIVINEKN